MKHCIIQTVSLYEAKEEVDVGAKLYDITAKSGIRSFAPTWGMVHKWKSHEITMIEYCKLYIELMRSTWMSSPKIWEELLSQESIALACYCHKDSFCHRHVLAHLIQQVLLSRNIKVTIRHEGKGSQMWDGNFIPRSPTHNTTRSTLWDTH